MTIKRHIPALCTFIATFGPLLIPTIAFAQAGGDMFVRPFETVLAWFQAVGGTLLVIGLGLLGLNMAKGEGNSLGKAAGLIIGGVIMLGATEVRDALFQQ